MEDLEALHLHTIERGVRAPVSGAAIPYTPIVCAAIHIKAVCDVNVFHSWCSRPSAIKV
jgi:hypothetical protein